MIWQQKQIETGQAMIDYALSTMPEPPLEALGDRPPLDRHLMYETDFNALADVQVISGTLTVEEGEAVKADFHVWVSGTRYEAPQTSPKFYE